MRWYRGYIGLRKTENGKKSKEKFGHGEKLRTIDEVRGSEDNFAGVLEPGVVLVDFDDAKQAEKALRIVEARKSRCRIVRTDRGVHLLYRNRGVEKCGTHVRLACGLEADIKLGDHNSYEVMCKDGVEREVEADPAEPDELPRWLLPVRSNTDFADLGEGDGRNQSLYNHILALTSAGLSREESREVINVINDFVLETPLGQDEIDTITRDEAFPEDVFYDGKRFRHDRFADFLLAEHHIVRIDGQLHTYDDGVYVPGYRHIEAAMLRHIPTMRATARTEVIKYLEIVAPETRMAPANLIAFSNGVYDLSTGGLAPFSPDVVVTNRIPWPYDPTTYSELADRTLDKLACGDKSIRALLEECIGYTFYRRNELSKAFLLTGDKSNGKSTFLDMVKNLLGPENHSALDMGELDERFSVATMAGKLANIGDDISDEFLSGRSVALFKKIVSGNQLKAEWKGQDPFFFSPYVKLLFSANDIPRIRDKTGAVLRRLVIIPFNAKFSKDDPDFDPYITHKLRAPEVMAYLVRIGVEGLRRVIEGSGFTDSKKVSDELTQYETMNNPVLLFLQERDRESIVHQGTRDVHRAYQVFCAENNFGQMSLISFVKEIDKRLNLRTKRSRVDGKLLSVFEEA